MRTLERIRASAPRPNGLLRLMSMIGMLVVLGLIIARAADPRMWTWLAVDDTANRARHAVAAHDVNWEEHVTPGYADDDYEEQAAAAEEFTALSDGNVELGAEEMPAYWRLFDWVQHQSTADLRKRATKEVVFNQFIRDPEEQRGKLFQLELDVRRVLEYPAPPNRAGIKKVYEIWGRTTESQAWLFEVLTAELPPGMPVGPDVHERAVFTGYFYKVQGYHAAGAGPRDRPLPAPLLIGRVSWRPSELRVARSQPQDWSRLWWVGGLAAVFGTLRAGLWLYARRQTARLEQADVGGEVVEAEPEVRGFLAAIEGDSQLPESRKHLSIDLHSGSRVDFHSN